MRTLALLMLWAVAAGAAAQVHVRSGLIVHAEVARGEEAAAALELFNAGTAPARLRVYLEDLSFDRGQPAYGTPGSTARSNAAWLTLPSTVVDVPPGQATLVPYTTRVPADSLLAGSYWSVALVEEVRPEPVEATDDGRRQVRFRRRSRLGVQLITHVAGAPGALGFEVSEEAVETGPDWTALVFTLANTGERALGPEVLAEVYGADGGLADTVSAGRPILYPGSSVRVRLPLAEAPAGHTALVLIDPGTDEVFGKELALDALVPAGDAPVD